MRFAAKDIPVEKKSPELGDRRVVTYFLVFPKTLPLKRMGAELYTRETSLWGRLGFIEERGKKYDYPDQEYGPQEQRRWLEYANVEQVFCDVGGGDDGMGNTSYCDWHDLGWYK